MNFLDVLKLLKQGQKVRRKKWDKKEKMWAVEGHLLHSHPFWDGQAKMIDSYFYTALLEDLEADDWEVIENTPS